MRQTISVNLLLSVLGYMLKWKIEFEEADYVENKTLTCIFGAFVSGLNLNV